MPVLLEHAMDEYLALVRAFPLVSIRDAHHLNEALAIIDRLTEQPTRTEAEEAYLSALTDLVETYEDAHVAIPPVSGLDALRYLLNENGLTEADIVPVLGTPALVSALLAGKRRLSVEHVKKVAAYFKVLAEVFLE